MAPILKLRAPHFRVALQHFLPPLSRRRWLERLGTLGVPAGLIGCAGTGLERVATSSDPTRTWINRLTWGTSAATARDWDRQGLRDALAQQLHPDTTTPLPAAVQARLDGLTRLQAPPADRVIEAEQRRRDGPREDYQRLLNDCAREAATRTLLLALHSPHQLREQMTWFWFNHFNVAQSKANLRLLVSDHEQGLRRHALGRFADLLIAATTHAAMLRYLDNEHNAVGRLNENHARELLELHTLGVDGGYGQRDVQELARLLTGLGVDMNPPPDRAGAGPGDGLTVFRPGRHDAGDKTVLGRVVRGQRGERGWDEILAQLQALARHPSTARHVCRKLAVYLVADAPPAALVERLAARFLATDGDIAQTLAALVDAPAFTASLGQKFKDPLHWIVSAARLAGDSAAEPLVDVAPLLSALGRLGQPLFGRTTPDGYPLDEAAWAGPGQLATRFELARSLARLGVAAGQPVPRFDPAALPPLSAQTREVLAQTRSPLEHNALLLSSPDFMRR